MKAAGTFLAIMLAISAFPDTRAGGEESQVGKSPAAVPHAQRILAWPGTRRATGAVPVRPRIEPSSVASSIVSTEPDSTVKGAAPDSTASAAAFAPIKLSSGGVVSAFGLAPDGLTVLWIEDVAGVAELFSRPVDASAAAVHLTAGLFSSGNSGVSGIDVSPDGSTVIFTGDFLVGFGTDSLASVPIGGGAITTLNNPVADEPVTDFLISPDGLVVLYLGLDTVDGSGRVEAYTTSISGGIPVQISSAGLSAHGSADVVSGDFTLDSTTVIYAADITADERFDLLASPLDGSSTTMLSSTQGTVTWSGISPTRVAYISDDDTFAVQEVYSVLTDGTDKLKLNSSMAGNATDLSVSPDGSRVAYRADQDTLGITEGYTAPIDVAGSSTRVHSPLPPSGDTDSVNITPDSANVVYRADELQEGVIELFSRPLDLGEPSTLLHDAATGQTVGLFVGRGVPVLNRRAVYPLFSATVDLYAVATDGTEPFARLNAPPVVGISLFSGYVPFEQTARLVAYGVGPSSSGITDRIFATPVRKDLLEEQFNLTAGPGDLGVENYLINGIETHGVYLQDQDTQGLPELYSAELDSDGDGSGNATDECKFVSNPGGTPAPLAQTLIADDATTFSWADRTEVRFAQGLLPLDGSYATTSTGSLVDANSFEDATTPAPGSGIWTLIAPDCAARDWGNGDRNLALP